MSDNLVVTIIGKDELSSVMKGIHNSMQGVADVAKVSLTAALGAATAAFAGLGAVLTISIKEAMEAEEVTAQLDAVLKSTGGAAGVARDEVLGLADSLSQVTRYSDETITTGESLLLTFTNIGKDVFPEATRALLDVSTAMKQDLKSSAIQLGKALNDPAQGLAALTRIGVTFTAEQENLVKSLMATGKTAEAQKVILQELQKEFGGSAQAAGETFGGQLDIAKNKLKNFSEELGNNLLPILKDLNKDILPALDSILKQISASIFVIKPHLEQLSASFGKLASEILRITGVDLSLSSMLVGIMNATTEIIKLVDTAKKFTDWLTTELPSAVATAETNFKSLTASFETAKTTLQPLTDAFKELSDSILEKSPQIETTIKTVEAAIKTLGIVMENTFKIVAPSVIKSFGGVIEELSEIWRKHGDTVLQVLRTNLMNMTTTFGILIAIVGGTIGLIAGILEGAVIWFGGIFDTFSLLLQGKWSEAFNRLVVTVAEAWAAVLSGFDTFGNTILGLLGTNMTTLRATWSTNWELVKTIVVTAWKNIQKAIAESIVKVMDALDQFVTDAINFFKKQYQTFYNIGQDFIEGLRKGIEDKFNHILKGLREMAGAMIDVVKDVLDMHSPSGVMRDIGANMMQSLQQGIADNMTLRVNRFDVQNRDSGGRGIAGQPYLIGRGAQPELFVPDSSGTFKPNAGGRGGVINVYFTYAPAVSLGDRYEAEQKLIPLIQQALRQL